jgi:hypothetical protein
MTFDNVDPNFGLLMLIMELGFFIVPGVMVWVLIWLFADILHIKFSRRTWVAILIGLCSLLPMTFFVISILGG